MEEAPQRQEEEWEDVNKTKSKSKQNKNRGGDRGGRSEGRGGRGREARGGRGRGGRGEGRGRSGRGDKFKDGPPNKQQQNGAPKADGQQLAADKEASVGVPKPVANVPQPKGAWGRALGSGSAPAAPASPERPAAQPQQQQSFSAAAPQPPKIEIAPPTVESTDVGVASKNDPTPSGMETKPVPRAVPPTGNVWATKGSAHLIQAENPKPPAPIAPAPTPPVVLSIPETITSKPSEPQAPATEHKSDAATNAAVASSLDTGLPPVATNAWGSKQATASTTAAAPSLDIPSSSAVIKESSIGGSNIAPVPSVEEPVASTAKAAAAASKPPRPTPGNVLNMGHWETGDNDDSQNLDFGFGSFGTDNDVAAPQAPAANETAPAPAPTTQSSNHAATGVSPARPPPGLSIGGMPPMPANAVLVHELENSLENTTLNNQPAQQVPQTQEKPTDNLPPPPAHMPGVQAGTPVLPGQQNFNQYGMPGMYSYNAAGNGFVGVHTPAGPPFLAGAAGVMPQQQQLPKGPGGVSPQPGATPQNFPQHPQGGLYGHHVSAPSSGNAPPELSVDANNNANAAAAPGMPPGMPANMPYNPAMYYGQQPFHLGQHQGGIGYNYGYGAQFGGAVQGGFGYQQVMGHPHFPDDGQHQQGQPHHGNPQQHGVSGGYQKNQGGYRGRNNHHNNQYQGQYNPQQYGGQPYGMGYHNDHFNQRGGYDPYGMQQQQQPGIHGGGFQDDNDHHGKGRRGGNNRNNNNNGLQFQQGGPMGGQQQPFGFQGNDAAQAGGGGWSNNNNNNQGGWSASGWQQGGN